MLKVEIRALVFGVSFLFFLPLFFLPSWPLLLLLRRHRHIHVSAAAAGTGRCLLLLLLLLLLLNHLLWLLLLLKILHKRILRKLGVRRVRSKVTLVTVAVHGTRDFAARE